MARSVFGIFRINLLFLSALILVIGLTFAREVPRSFQDNSNDLNSFDVNYAEDNLRGDYYRQIRERRIQNRQNPRKWGVNIGAPVATLRIGYLLRNEGPRSVRTKVCILSPPPGQEYCYATKIDPGLNIDLDDINKFKQNLESDAVNAGVVNAGDDDNAEDDVKRLDNVNAGDDVKEIDDVNAGGDDNEADDVELQDRMNAGDDNNAGDDIKVLDEVNAGDNAGDGGTGSGLQKLRGCKRNRCKSGKKKNKFQSSKKMKYDHKKVKKPDGTRKEHIKFSSSKKVKSSSSRGRG